METPQLKSVIEALLLAAGRPLSIDQLLACFGEHEQPERKELRNAIAELQEDFAERAIEIIEVGGGYRVQVRDRMKDWVGRLWEEKPARYSRALLETLALIAYRQPITRGEIEEVRGVTVSSSIIRTLLEREWVQVVGHRDVPGRPAMYGTTRQFLNYFSLKSLDQLPSLAELRDLMEIGKDLQLDLNEIPGLLEAASAEQDAAGTGEDEPAEARPSSSAPADEEHSATLH